MGRRNLIRSRVKKAITGSYGIVSRVSSRTGYSWKAVRDFIQNDEELLSLMKQEEELVDDLAETNLIDEISKGNIDVTRWWLARRRARYSDKVDANINGNLVVNLKWGDEDMSGTDN